MVASITIHCSKHYNCSWIIEIICMDHQQKIVQNNNSLELIMNILNNKTQTKNVNSANLHFRKKYLSEIWKFWSITKISLNWVPIYKNCSQSVISYIHIWVTNLYKLSTMYYSYYTVWYYLGQVGSLYLKDGQILPPSLNFRPVHGFIITDCLEDYTFRLDDVILTLDR